MSLRRIRLHKNSILTNNYYKEIRKAYIYKKPTPIQVIKVDYSKNSAIIKEAYFTTPSTTDYNGIYKGKYIDFEAKETKSKTSFPISNIHNHQIIHLKKVIEHGGIAFIIVRFTTLNKTFLLDANKLLKYMDEYNIKSIPITFFESESYIINDSLKPVVNYLSIIDKYFIGGIKWRIF